MRDLFHFDSMITPRIITFVYWLLLLGCVIGFLSMLASALGTMKYSVLAGFGLMVLAPVVAVFGAIVARIYCELMIVVFKMNEALQDIRRK